MGSLSKRSARKAVQSQVVAISLVFALVLTAASGSGLPLLLWALGTAAWVVLAATSASYARRVMGAEMQADDRQRCEQRQGQRAALATQLGQAPFQRWIADGSLPNYAQVSAELERARAQVAELAQRREDLAVELSLELGRNLDRLLEFHLALAEARLGGLRRLGALPTPGKRLPALRELEMHLGELDRRQQQDPSLAVIGSAHREVLRRRIEHLQQGLARDVRLGAQLDAVPDVFTWVLEHLGEPGSDGREVSQHLEKILLELEGESGERSGAPRPPAEVMPERAAVRGSAVRESGG